MMTQESDSSNEPVPPAKVPFWKMVLSVMSASFGVQNRKNRERDFSSGSITGFVVAGLLFVFLFVMVLVTVVRTVLP